MNLPASPFGAGFRGYAPPAIAATLTILLLWSLPASGPVVFLEWQPTIAASTREAIERELGLHDPIHTGGMRWGYILADESEANVKELLARPEIAGRSGLRDDPPRAAGIRIIRLAGPFAIQSLIGLLAGVLLIVGAGASSTRMRQAYFLVAVACVAMAWSAARLPDVAGHEVGDWMGDYDTYTEDRANFQEYFGYDHVRFHFHLGGFVLNLIDRSLGATETSPRRSFEVLATLTGVLALLEAALVAVVAKWSPQALRYAGLCIAAPFALMFFGFKETGYLSLSVAGLPLVLIGLEGTGSQERDIRAVQGGALILGVHAALQGLGLVAIATGLIIAALYPMGVRLAISRVLTVAGWSLTAYLIWLPLYLIVLALPVFPGHAVGIPFRGLLEPHEAYNRVVAPLVSSQGLREIGAAAVVVGVPVVVLAFAAARRGRERLAMIGCALPSLALVALLWPAQGLNQEMDVAVVTCPALFAGAWICAARPRFAIAAFGLLAAGHAMFWHVVRSQAFSHPPL